MKKKYKVILKRVVNGKEERETIFLSEAAAKAVKRVHDREKQRRSRLKKFFRLEWCPLFGVLPEPGEISPNDNRLIDSINAARKYLGGTLLSCFDNWCDLRRKKYILDDIKLCMPRSESYDPFCPSIFEIKKELFSIYLVDIHDIVDPLVDPFPADLKKIFGVDEAQILAARDFHKQSESRHNTTWKEAYERAHKLVYGHGTDGLEALGEIQFFPKKKRTLHGSLDDGQVLAIVSISLCYSALKKIFMNQDYDQEFIMGTKLLEKIVDGHVRMSRKVVSPEDSSTQVGDGKKKKKAQKDNKTKKAIARQRDRRLQEWANAIWEKDPSLSKASVADSIKKKHPKIKLETGTIAKKIEKNLF